MTFVWMLRLPSTRMFSLSAAFTEESRALVS